MKPKMDITLQTLSFSSTSSSSSLLSPSLFQSKCNLAPTSLVHVQCKGGFFRQVKRASASVRIAQERIGISPINNAAASQGNGSTTNVAERWLLEPVGDGDFRHIGYKVEMPSAFEIPSDVVTVGRVPDRADIVIPVATVSGLHAQIQRNEDTLLVTDLDSTNGTFINEKRLTPGVTASASPGSLLTFGDTHLAIFRVSKLEYVEPATSDEESKEKPETESSETKSWNI